MKTDNNRQLPFSDVFVIRNTDGTILDTPFIGNQNPLTATFTSPSQNNPSQNTAVLNTLYQRCRISEKKNNSH